MRSRERRKPSRIKHRADADRVQKGLPGLRPPSPTPRHVLGDRRLRDLDPELEQFAMDARRAPQPVGQAHLPDQAADLPGNLRPTAPRARLPAPVQSEARPMPSDDGLRLDNRHSVQHRRKQAIEPDEEQSVGHRQFRLRGNAPAQHIQLMPQQHDLGFQPRLRLERRDQDVEEQDQERDHRASAYPISPLTPARMEYSVRIRATELLLNERLCEPLHGGHIFNRAVGGANVWPCPRPFALLEEEC